MTAKEKAKELVNEKYYQPITLHLNVNSNSREMWEYAKRCALIAIEEVISEIKSIEFGYDADFSREINWHEEIKKEIENL